MPCEFCDELDKYGLLPAQKMIIEKTTWQEGSGKQFKMIHPPKDPITGFVGVECKMDRTEVER
jgi:hypothetical protein